MKRIVLNERIHDTTRLSSIYLLLDSVYEDADFDYYNALMGKIAKKNIAKEQNNSALKKIYVEYLAVYYANLGIRDEENGAKNPFVNINKSIEVYKSIDAFSELNLMLVSKGLMLYRRKQYKKAIDCYFKALKYFEANQKENIDNLCYLYLNLGVVYMEQGLQKESLKWYNKSISYFEKKENPLTVDQELNKCSLYMNVGSLYATFKEFDKADDYLNKSLVLAKKHKRNDLISSILGRIAVIDMHFKKYDEAFPKLIEASNLSEDTFFKSFALINLGKLYYHKKNTKKAEINLEEGLRLALSIKRNDLIKESSQLLFKINKSIGNYKRATEMLEIFQKYNDNSRVIENNDILKRQELKYEYEKKELNYKLQTERKNALKNNMLIGLGSLLLLLIVGSYLLYRNYKQKQVLTSYEKNELKQKLLLSQMNPHFIFNSIDNIQSLIYNKQEKEAVNYLTKFSKLTRQILENSNENYITLEEELAMTDNYLNIQRLLYNNKFDFTINLNEGLDEAHILIPPMITQPFIENAIKHGLKNTSEQGQIAIAFKMRNDKLLFTVEDNGEGFQELKTENTKKSMAMKITKERLKSISKKSDFEVHTENLFDENQKIIGAKVYFEIPYIYEN